MKRNNFILLYILVLVFAASFLFTTCAKESEQPDTSAKEESSSMDIDARKDVLGKRAVTTGKAKPDTTKRDERDLATYFLAPMGLAGDRLLEYRVNLIYETKDLFSSRQYLLTIVSKYGFINSSASTTESKSPYMNAHIFVRSNLLYDALVDLEKLGIMLSEKITVVDHTEQMVLAQRKLKRETIRIIRKQRAIGRVSPAAKTWKEREASLERCEDGIDKSEHEKWKIKDRVTWAKIHVYLKGPDLPDRIEIPNYRDALIGLINVLLYLSYVIIVLLPLVVIGGLIWWKRKRIAAFFAGSKRDV